MDPSSYLTANWQMKYGPVPKGYRFYGNLYIKDKSIWLTISGGSSAGQDLGHWLVFLAIDNNKLFGPPKKQRAWSEEKLKNLKAVGFYIKD